MSCKTIEPGGSAGSAGKWNGLISGNIVRRREPAAASLIRWFAVATKMEPGVVRIAHTRSGDVDADEVIVPLRNEGKTVFVHCVQATSRTPSVAALYAIRHCGADVARAWSAVSEVLPDAQPKKFLVDAVARVGDSNVMGEG